MGKIVAAFGTVHAPQLFVRPPSEDLAQLDADIAAMRLLGKDLDETKPDVAIVIGNDHMETFFLSSVPTFAIMSGERAHAEFARKTYDLPVHQGLAEDLLDKLVNADFDMAYSQDAVLAAMRATWESHCQSNCRPAGTCRSDREWRNVALPWNVEIPDARFRVR